jgi:archaellum component FlaC
MESLKEKTIEYDEYGERIAKCEQEINELRLLCEKANRPVFESKDGVDQDAIDVMLENWKKEMYTMFATKENLNTLADRVTKLEEELPNTTDTANTNKEDIEKLFKLLDNKLDSDVFDSEIKELTEAIKNAGGDVSKVASSTSGGLSTKEINKLKDMIEKFSDFEKALKDLQNRLDKTEKDIYSKYDNAVDKISSDLKALKDLLDRLSGDMNFMKTNGAGSGDNNSASPDIIIQITNKIEKLEIKLGNLVNEFDSMKRAKSQTVSMPQQQVQTGSNIEESRIKTIEDKLKGLDQDLKSFNIEIIKEIKHHQDQINGKADYTQLDELRENLLSKIDDLLRGFKQFADKNETKKALKNLEKQLKNLYDLVMSRLQGGVDEEDAMFSKKPLGGFSCAS